MGRSGKQPQHQPKPALGDEHATQLATGKLSFDDDGHVEVQWLVALADGSLSNALRDEVLAHLSSCERCRHVVAEVGQEATVRHEPPQARTVDAMPAADLVGQTVGEYEVLEKLSEGGMGMVYRGVQPVIGKAVAIKVMLPAFAKDSEHSHRLLAEARAVNAIRHPNIVDVFAFGALPDGRQYFVMELLAGQSLSTLVNAGPIELIDVVNVLEQASAALVAAHSAGVVHRDLKPSNIFVTPLPDGLHVTVLDFGMAKSVAKPLTGRDTLPGQIVGTPGFMAPEQIRGAEVGPATDVYAMGCVAFLLLSGKEVFDAEANIDQLRLHLEAPRPSLARFATVPPVLVELVGAMLEIEPAKRPAAADVKKKLSRLRKDLTPAAANKRVKKEEPSQPLPPTAYDRPAAAKARSERQTEPSQPAAVVPVGNMATERELPAVGGRTPSTSPSGVTAPVRRRRVWPFVAIVLALLGGAGAALVWRFLLH